MIVSRSYTDKGPVRSENQDSLFSGKYNVAVFDGMGGESCGAECSHTAEERYKQLFADRQFTSADEVREAMDQYADEAQELIMRLLDSNNARNGGTTLAGVSFTSAGTAMPYWIGDSRVYLYRRGRITLLTHDMTSAQEQIDEGELTPEEAPKTRAWHLLTHFIGDEYSKPAFGKEIQIEPGDKFLLCSDGVSDAVTEKMLRWILWIPCFNIQKALIRYRVMKHGEDNFTFIINTVKK